MNLFDNKYVIKKQMFMKIYKMSLNKFYDINKDAE